MEGILKVLEENKKGLTAREMRAKGIQVQRRILRLLERQEKITKTMQGGSPAEYCYILAEVGETNS